MHCAASAHFLHGKNAGFQLFDKQGSLGPFKVAEEFFCDDISPPIPSNFKFSEDGTYGSHSCHTDP